MSFIRYSSIFLLTLTLVGCNPLSKKKVEKDPTILSQPEQIILDYNGPTNVELLMRACRNIKLDFLEKGLINPNDPILVASLEYPGDSEIPAFPVANIDPRGIFMEDILTTIITDSGYKTSERDLDILSRLFHENDDQYLISLSPDLAPEDMIKELVNIVLDVKDGSSRKDVEDFFFRVIGEVMGSNMPYIRNPFHGEKPLQETSQLRSASYILSFRVLECGMRTKPLQEKFKDHFQQVERIAMAKIHLRLTDRKGVTIWSGMVEGTDSERTPVKMLPLLENEGLEFFGYSNPVSKTIGKMFPEPRAGRGEPEEEKSTGEKLKEKFTFKNIMNTIGKVRKVKQEVDGLERDLKRDP